MIDLGKSKKVTAVLKFQTQFSPKGLNQIFSQKDLRFLMLMVLTKPLEIFFTSAFSIELCSAPFIRSISYNHSYQSLRDNSF